MTGEPDQCPKVRIDADNARDGASAIMFGKSLVVGGSGTAVVCAVGDHSVSGIIESKS